MDELDAALLAMNRSEGQILMRVYVSWHQGDRWIERAGIIQSIGLIQALLFFKRHTSYGLMDGKIGGMSLMCLYE